MKVEHHESKQICIGFSKAQLIDALVNYAFQNAPVDVAHEIKAIKDTPMDKNTNVKYSLISGGKEHGAGLDLQITINMYKGSANGKNIKVA